MFDFKINVTKEWVLDRVGEEPSDLQWKLEVDGFGGFSLKINDFCVASNLKEDLGKTQFFLINSEYALMRLFNNCFYEVLRDGRTKLILRNHANVVSEPIDVWIEEENLLFGFKEVQKVNLAEAIEVLLRLEADYKKIFAEAAEEVGQELKSEIDKWMFAENESDFWTPLEKAWSEYKNK